VDAVVIDPLSRSVDRIIEHDVLPELSRYITIPALSPAFDASWKSTGAIDAAMDSLARYARLRRIASLEIEISEIEGRTPALVCVVESNGTDSSTTLIYGHLDKQPPLGPWREGLDAFTAVREGDRLYGRGAADDGYAFFAALAAIEALEECDGHHGRVVILIESSEESGSPDLEAHLDVLHETIGQPDLVVCLDSGCATYDRLWITTSLRGIVTGTLRIAVAREGTHSGLAGGVVPSPWRIARTLLGRIEDGDTGDVTLPELQSAIPPHRLIEIAEVAEDLGEAGAGVFPLLEGVEPEGVGARDRIARGTWHAAIAIIGQEGLPAIGQAGNVAIPALALKLAIRLPPNVAARAAGAAIRSALTSDPPGGAHVTFEFDQIADGWDSPPLDRRIGAVLERSSIARFGRLPSSIGLGGSIPFLGVFGLRYPRSQLIATGVLGPESNAHGPNEFLHLPTLRALTCTLVDVLDCAR
jgi:acetylornithine deacetylase/succinyl-diaminopimelate desuccinylase-like protein